LAREKVPIVAIVSLHLFDFRSRLSRS